MGRAAVTAVGQLSVGERTALGKAARKLVPRSSHAAYEPAPDRPDPVALLERQGRDRVAELLPIRYGRMLLSPFTFYRGAALIMASDLAGTPRSGIEVQLCGDAHLSNFGVFGSPERRLVFDINDFDETLPGPWEWDVKRLAASIVIAAQDRDFTPKLQAQAALETVESYRLAMREFAGMGNLAVWYASFDVERQLAAFEDQLTPRIVKRTSRTLARARTRDSMSAFSKLTELIDGEPRIVSDPPLIVPISELAPQEGPEDRFSELDRQLREYEASLPSERRHLIAGFRLVDVAHKVVGVGSVGTRSWIALLLGRDGSDPLLLQMKEAQRCVLEEFLQPSEFDHDGERVVAGQRLMQATSDVFLGWARTDSGLDGRPRDFYVRQLKDWKASAEIERMKPAALTAYGRLCGWTLARAHARSGDRIAIASYLGAGRTFDRALLEFSLAYAEQSRLDHAALGAAVDAGRIAATPGL
jgi:uncharacterized protein (DUF2252 family)